MNAPSTIAPHLTREQSDYIALTAPEDDRFDRLATSLLALEIDGKPITGAVAASLAAQIIDEQIEFCECPVDAADIAIAVAEPALRAKHRAELFDEVVAYFERLERATTGGAWHVEHMGNLLREYQQATATRPVDAADGEVVK